jgi:hypothetical protein
VRLKLTHRAGLHERFAPGCFDARIGDPWPVRLPSGDLRPALLVAAEVAPDGSSVELTIEVGEQPGRWWRLRAILHGAASILDVFGTSWRRAR